VTYSAANLPFAAEGIWHTRASCPAQFSFFPLRSADRRIRLAIIETQA